MLLLMTAVALVRSQIGLPAKDVRDLTKTSVTPQGEKAGVSPTTIASDIPLLVFQPANGVQVSESLILVSGKTAANAEVFINEKETVADVNGNFRVTLDLDEGENLIIVTANDEDGNIAEQEFVVTYNVEE